MGNCDLSIEDRSAVMRSKHGDRVERYVAVPIESEGPEDSVDDPELEKVSRGRRRGYRWSARLRPLAPPWPAPHLERHLILAADLALRIQFGVCVCV